MPILLSTLDSTLFWKSCGVVVEEKLEFMMTCSSDLYFLKKELIRVVFAEPCSPISNRFLRYSFTSNNHFKLIISKTFWFTPVVQDIDISSWILIAWFVLNLWIPVTLRMRKSVRMLLTLGMRRLP